MLYMYMCMVGCAQGVQDRGCRRLHARVPQEGAQHHPRTRTGSIHPPIHPLTHIPSLSCPLPPAPLTSSAHCQGYPDDGYESKRALLARPPRQAQVVKPLPYTLRDERVLRFYCAYEDERKTGGRYDDRERERESGGFEYRGTMRRGVALA